MQVLGALQRPFTTLLLDFGPAYDRHGMAMFQAGEVGQRGANPEHLRALARFLGALLTATPDATSRHVQIYLFNGPGTRRAGYSRAFPQDPERFDRAVQQNDRVRADIVRFVEALDDTLAPFRDRVDLRLVGSLEKNTQRDRSCCKAITGPLVTAT